MAERQPGRIEAPIQESLTAAPEGSKQQAQAQLLVTLLNALKADGFEDLPFKTTETSQLSTGTNVQGIDIGQKVEVPLPTELDLNAEWQRQTTIRIELGFHKEAGFADTDEGKQAFLDTLPRFEPQPEEYKGRLDAPRLVIGKIIPWERQAELAGIPISDYLRERIAKTVPINKRSEIPQGSYTGWFNQWGQRFENKIAPDAARKELQKDEVGSGPYEIIADHLADPALNASGRFWDGIGYNVESDGGPCLSRWNDRPKFSAHWGGNANGNFRPSVRGSKIVTK